jgi:sn-glycerol 3-phosphate transport system ATP-binding protein
MLDGIPEEAHYIGFRPEHAGISSAAFSFPHTIGLESEILALETLGAETVYKVKNRIGIMNIRSFTAPIPKRNGCFVSIPFEKLYPFDAERIAGPSLKLPMKKEAAFNGVD